MPSQHGVHTYLGAGGAQIGPKAYCTIAEFRSLPEILKDAGYVCGLSGKWHLGGNLTPQEGFTYWVTMPHGHTTTFYDAEVIEDGKVRKEPGYLTDFWTDRAVRFIEPNKDRPFFLFLAYNGPYGLGESLNHPARNRHAAYYADKDLPSFPRETTHPWLHANKQFLNNVEAMRRYAAEVSGVDDGVGRVMEALKKHGLDENTLVVFTADQGLAGGHGGFWGMGDHTRPLTGYDWTMHVPLIWRHPGRVAAGKRTRPAREQLRLPADRARLPGPQGQAGRRAAVARPELCRGAARRAGRVGQRRVLRVRERPRRPHRPLEVHHPLPGRAGRAVRPDGRPGRADEPDRPGGRTPPRGRTCGSGWTRSSPATPTRSTT